MQNQIIETLAEKALENIDMDSFVKQLAQKLLKEVEKSILQEVKNMEWGDFVYDAIQTDALSKAISKQIIIA